MNVRLPAISAILVLIVIVAPLLAHHSVQAQFDLNKPITLTGKITKVEWINPHSYLLMEVSDDKYEMAGPGALRKSGLRDRKSTRLNSSHGYISYAVFCLKKKKHK